METTSPASIQPNILELAPSDVLGDNPCHPKATVVSIYGQDGARILSSQSGAHVTCYDDNVVCKSGHRVRPSEEVAMRLVIAHTHVPIPQILFTSYRGEIGKITMAFNPGTSLKSVWSNLDDKLKERLCRKTWAMIAQWRQIPRPSHLANIHQCLADGSAATEDPLLKDTEDPARPLVTDEAIRQRIHERYLLFAGQRYADTLVHMLPRSSSAVFTHGDVAPRNIMVDSDFQITAILDWELAGWYPDYWEYANIMKPSMDDDWQQWMDRTAPRKWDLSGIDAARRVLF